MSLMHSQTVQKMLYMCMHTSIGGEGGKGRENDKTNGKRRVLGSSLYYSCIFEIMLKKLKNL